MHTALAHANDRAGLIKGNLYRQCKQSCVGSTVSGCVRITASDLPTVSLISVYCVVHLTQQCYALRAPTNMCDWGLRRNALHLAARSCNVAMLRLLVEGEDAAAAAAYVNEPDKSGITALFLAMQKGARRSASWRSSMYPFAL